jgi:NADPH:quinone reductase-like Zn-dependent oxidoreductase
VSREGLLRGAGADEVFVDDGEIAAKVASSGKGGFDKVLELVGTTTLRDSLKCTTQRGTVCMTGIQGGAWELEKLTPFDDLPNNVRLCCYGGGGNDWQALPWDDLVREADEGHIKIPVKSFKLDEIQKVHEILESGGGGSKMVVVVEHTQ